MRTDFFSTSGDSLYKFLAVLGLALFLSPSLLTKDYLAVESEIIDHERDISLQNKKIAAANEEMAAMFHDTEIMQTDIATKRARLEAIGRQDAQIHALLLEMQQHKRPVDLEQLKTLQKQLTSLGIEVNEKQLDFKAMESQVTKKEAETDAIKLRLEQLQEVLDSKNFDLQKVSMKVSYLERESAFNIACRIVGAFMVIFGFGLWYYKIQVHADKSFSEGDKKPSGRRSETPKAKPLPK